MLPDLHIYLIQAILFAIPCWIVNISFNLINPFKKRYSFIRNINKPLDFNIVLGDGERLLGGSQGFLSIFLIFFIPALLSITGLFGSYCINFIKAFCVFIGDMLGSFIKRRLHIKRGSFLVGVDHADYMIVSTIVFVSLHIIDIPTACIAIILTYIFHPLVCILGYNLGIKDEKY